MDSCCWASWQMFGQWKDLNKVDTVSGIHGEAGSPSIKGHHGGEVQEEDLKKV